jgi:WD40 repeat protein/cell division protein FtsL
LQGEELTTTARRRSADTAKLMHLLRGDLDWIVMKCLEKDRTRRYETANGLAADINRHLNNEPVVARPPSTAYKFQKAFRRNKLAFVASVTVAAALLFGIIVSTWQSVRATRAKREAVAAQASESVQRQKAEANEQKAIVAQASESRLREQAQAEELAARQRAYASDMNVAKQALDGNNLGRALDLLNRQQPQPGQKDLRGWEWRYLWAQTRSDALFTLCQQSSAIESLAASPDGRWLAVGLEHKDGLFVYDLQTRQAVAHLAASDGGVRAAFSPAESLLAFTSLHIPASGEARATLHLWNTATRQMVAEFPLDSKCWGLAFDKEGRTLVTSIVGQIILWRMPEGTRLAAYPRPPDSVAVAQIDFATTSNLGLAAYGTESGEVRVMDLRNGKILWSAVASKQRLTGLEFSPDGKMLASAAGFGEKDIRLWDVAAGKEIEPRLEGHSRWAGSLVFWPDGKKAASCSADQTIRIWDLASRACLDVLRGHRLEVWRLVLLPDNKTLVSGSKDGEVCLWDTSVTHPHQPRIVIPDNVVNWQFSPDNQSVLTLNRQGQVKRWTGNDFQRSELLLDTGTNAFSNNGINCSYFSRDGRFIAGSSGSGNISVWDLSRRVLRLEFKPGDGRCYPLNFLDQGNRLIVLRVADRRFSEWDLESNREIQSWPAPVRFNGLGVSPDERLAVAVGFEGQVICRDLQNHTTTNLPLDALEGWTVDFSSDGTALVISSALGYARVWDTATWREEATLRGFLNAVNQAVFSPDNLRLVTSGSNPDDAVKLWSGDTRQELLTLEGAGHQADLTAVSPDSNIIGVMSGDGILSLWRAPSWDEINAAEAKDKMETRQP